MFKLTQGQVLLAVWLAMAAILIKHWIIL